MAIQSTLARFLGLFAPLRNLGLLAFQKLLVGLVETHGPVVRLSHHLNLVCILVLITT